ncbi:MAG: DUF1294 domain-containing protein [Clostridia bacterium]|nr:DUF1294 domain-containing protein [Clostridia bacterium]
MLRVYLIFSGIMGIVTFLLFGIDKLLSKKEENPRIPEIVLLGFSSFGGGLGGILGRILLHHKNNFKTKFHFAIGVWTAFLLQAALAVYIFVSESGIV